MKFQHMVIPILKIKFKVIFQSELIQTLIRIYSKLFLFNPKFHGLFWDEMKHMGQC